MTMKMHCFSLALGVFSFGVPPSTGRVQHLLSTSPRSANTDGAIGLLIVMYPILCKVKYETLHPAFRKSEIWIYDSSTGL